ncbi:Thoeris anti-defense Tad2 family protein [Ligilactobacillus salivarius]|uniref:Thoeris anti-defense Tad2 family protein n=1 Tax=Ligilactobacillus salivarius TaxID=1624 RepID=UPI000BB076D5|nr:hypothetical protein [Ligilactobacillus salivarius]PAY37417.1 hypothetical protein A8C54_04805 [Ligilactobacillus salivarius]PAY42227.1 hypothetical protein A8C34_03780 [Ligilactobacillus salivarius]PAY42897.1 hypothetical protein A8C55_10995 [Ligilactobacillus salivarius]
MYINQAVKQALKTNKGMIRADSDMVLFPTSSDFGCILVVPCDSKNFKSSIRWNPNAEDLIANDWEVL